MSIIFALYLFNFSQDYPVVWRKAQFDAVKDSIHRFNKEKIDFRCYNFVIDEDPEDKMLSIGTALRNDLESCINKPKGVYFLYSKDGKYIQRVINRD